MHSDFSLNSQQVSPHNILVIVVLGVASRVFTYKRKIVAYLDLLNILQSGGEMSKRLGGIIGCKYQTSSWHLNGLPDGSNIGSTV